MSQVHLNISLVSQINHFMEQNKAYLQTNKPEKKLPQADKKSLQFTPDEEEMYLMFAEDAVLYSFCR